MPEYRVGGLESWYAETSLQICQNKDRASECGPAVKCRMWYILIMCGTTTHRYICVSRLPQCCGSSLIDIICCVLYQIYLYVQLVLQCVCFVSWFMSCLTQGREHHQDVKPHMCISTGTARSSYLVELCCTSMYALHHYLTTCGCRNTVITLG